MRFFPDQPERLVPVTYYFVPDDTPFVPWPSAFGSRVWDYQDEADPPYGEQNFPRRWYGGQKPPTAGNGGLCGTAEQWLNGCKPDDPIPPAWPGSDVCSRCSPPQLRSYGGTGTGGQSSDPTPLGCCGGAPPPDNLLVEYLGPAIYPNLPVGTVLAFRRWQEGDPQFPYFADGWITDYFPWGDFTMYGNLGCVDFGGGDTSFQCVFTDNNNTFFMPSDYYPSGTCAPFRLDFQFFASQPGYPPLPPTGYWRVTAPV